MTKKQSMPDFTSAFTSSLSADLKEAAAKMRRMSQPPKHPSQPGEAIQEETATVPNQSLPEPCSPPLASPTEKTPLSPQPEDKKTCSTIQDEVTNRYSCDVTVLEKNNLTSSVTPKNDSLNTDLGKLAGTDDTPSANVVSAILCTAPPSTKTIINSHQQSLAVEDCLSNSTEQSETVTNSNDTFRAETPSPGHDEKAYSHKQSTTVITSYQQKAPKARPLISSTKERASAENLEPLSFRSHKQSPDVIDNKSIEIVEQNAKENEERAQKNRPSITSATLQEAHIGGARQIILDALQELQQHAPRIIVNLKRLAPALGLSYGTVRNTVSRLVHEGVICTTQVRTGDVHGVCIEFIDDYPLPSMTVMKNRPVPAQNSTELSLTETNYHQQSLLKKTIWDSDENLILILWPHAANAGFKPFHLAELYQAYQVQGWEADNVARCLRYLDWELSCGLLNPSAHVTAWLRIMQRQGHYPRPEGYVDPEVLRIRQQAEEEQALAEAKATRR